MAKASSTTTESTASAPPTIQLTAEQAAVFDRMKSEAEKASKFRKHDKAAGEAKDELKEIFGDAVIGITPDGRHIVRTVKVVSISAKKAYDQERVTFESL